MNKFVSGQRWISETEPELGLGKVIGVEGRNVHIQFAASDVMRCYAVSSAPLRRVRFRVGDRIQGSKGRSFVIQGVNERDGILIYQGDKTIVSESELSDSISFSTPEERLLAGQVDPSRLFDLRCQTLGIQFRARQSSARGFLGGRIELIAHQFFIAHETATRQAPRVLLSDETGLGKTIEACLVLHRLIVIGRINRVLILLPETLVHQWFVELLRRFNLLFKIFDEEICASIEQGNPGGNPFFEDQLIICSLDFIRNQPIRTDQIVSAPWDMLIVDEAHHIGENSPAYDILSSLAEKIPSLMLLTATPEQFGQQSHFARLRLLDSARYYDFGRFQNEMKDCHEVASMAGRLLDDKPLKGREKKMILTASGLNLSPDDLEEALWADPELRQRLINDLIDRYGIGRVVFRNTRRTIKGFPRRKAHLVALSLDGNGHAYLANLAQTFDSETGGRNQKGLCEFESDPRIKWLAELLRKLDNEKVLLICHSVEKVLAVNRALANRIRVKTALFHEDLSLIQRDRNAAWFSESEGARILLCSEIGSEGRNFQFARHLVLFDLPLDPELLEQRIGRLDRIGQKSTVHIYAPYIRGSVQEVLARWLHEGLNALERNLPGGRQVLEEFGSRVKALAMDYFRPDSKNIDALEGIISESVSFRKDLSAKLRKGKDRLLELCAFRPVQAKEILSRVETMDNDLGLDHFMLKIFDHFGIDGEPIGYRSFQLRPNLDFDETFPGFRGEAMTVTFDRATAIGDERLVFLNWDHPMVIGALEVMLGSEKGNCACAIWQEQHDPTILLEAVFVLECVAPACLHVDRFLPATPVRTMVNAFLEDTVRDFFRERLSSHLEDCAPDIFMDNPSLVQDLFPKMMEKAHDLAEKEARQIIEKKLADMNEIIGREINRLKNLALVNPNIREQEITLAVHEKDALQQHISTARLRLDALRLIWKGPFP